MRGEAAYGKYEKEKAAAEGRLKEAGHGVSYVLESLPNGFMTVKVWRGKAGKPSDYYRVRSEESAMEVVERRVARAKASVAYRAERAAEKKERAAEMAEKLKVGTLLSYSWGYEQTNVDFFEITAKKGKTVTLRKIAAKTVKTTGWASANVRPCPGEFIGRPFTKRITPYGVSFAHGIGSPTTAESTHYCSWYH